MNRSSERLFRVLACAACRGPLDRGDGTLTCRSCGAGYRVCDGVPVMLGQRAAEEVGLALGSAEGRHRLAGRVLGGAARMFGSEYAPLRRRFRRPIQDLVDGGGVVLEVGSGRRRLHDDIINMDIEPHEEVDIVGVAEQLPIADECLDGVVLEVSLEHIRNVSGAVDEAVRVLKPGGRVFVVAPFLFPFHGCPDDYWRFSRAGLRELFRSVEEVDSGTYHGPTSMILNVLTDMAAGLVFRSRGAGFLVVKGLLLLPVFWLKYADAVLGRLPGADSYASTLFFIGVRR